MPCRVSNVCQAASQSGACHVCPLAWGLVPVWPSPPPAPRLPPPPRAVQIHDLEELLRGLQREINDFKVRVVLPLHVVLPLLVAPDTPRAAAPASS